MPVYNLGQLNTTALSSPDTYILKVPPPTVINGVPTDINGQVGVGSWGPVNSAVLALGDTFGPVTFRAYDLATAIAISAQVGSNNIRAVRVTDGTDTAASVHIVDTAGSPGIGTTLTAFYTGTIGNTLSYTTSAGSKPNTTRLTINRTGYNSEVYDNLAGSGGALWAAAVSAVNNGQTGLRGPSQIAVATIGTSVLAPKLMSAAFSGGTDGASGVTDTTIVGVDGVLPSQRTGLYALRSSGCQVANVVDLVDTTQWPNITAFADSEGMYIPLAGQVGASYSTVSTNLTTVGVDDPSVKPLVGDWAYWQDNVNGVLRLVSPATFAAAELASLSPEKSSLNKPLPGVVGTQRSSMNQPYSSAEIGAIATARLDAIVNPCPGGPYFGFRTGRNGSSDPTRNGDNYTRMINYLSLTLAGAFGFAIGEPQTGDLRLDVEAATDFFLSNLEAKGMIGNVNGGPAFGIEIDAKNNPSSQVSLGYMQMAVQVTFLSIVWFFLVNLQGGQTVTVTLVNTQST